MVQLALALLCTVLPKVQDGLLTKTAPADIEAAYKALAPFNGVEWTREDRPGLVMFVEKSERKELKYLVEIRAFVLGELRTKLAKELGKAMGMELGPRPLVVWLCKDVQRADALAGSAEVWDGYDRTRGHVLCAPGIPAAEAGLIESLVRGATMALVDGGTVKGARVQLSDWLRLGVAAHYATRPPGPMLMKSDPLLGTFARDQFTGMFDLAKRPPPLTKPAKMPRHHHPMGVALFDTLGQYLESCGTTAGDARESQVRRFLEHSHLMASMFLRGFGNGMHAALTEIVAAEAAGKHGDASFSGSFSGEVRREKLASLVAVFAANAREAADQALPEGTVVTGGGAAAENGGSVARFADPAGEALPATPAPEEMPLARALLAALDLQPDEGQKLLEGRSGKDAEAIAGALKKQKELLDLWRQKLAAGEKPTLFLPDPEKPKDLVQFTLVEWKAGEPTLKLKRGSKELTWLTRWVPPHQFGDSLVRLKVPIDDAGKACLGLLASLFASGKPDAKDLLGRAKKSGFIPTTDVGDRLAGLVQVIGHADKLARDLEGGGADGQKALAAFESGIKAVPKAGASEKQAARALLAPLLPRLWATGAFLAGSMRGKCTVERGGKVRLEYGWKNAGELNDWLTVDPDKEEFQPWGQPFAGGKATVDDDKLVMEGALILRHKLQLEGDVEVNLLGAGIEEETDEGPRRIISPEPLVGVYARPGGHMIVLSCYGSVALMKRGVAEGDKGGKEAEFGELFTKAMSDATGFTMRRTGNNLTVRVANSEVCKVAVPADYANVGAVVIIHRGGEKKVLCDRLVVTGKLLPGSGGALLNAWAKEVLGRL